MGSRLRDLSVRRKLPLIATVTSAVALLLASGAFLAYDLVTSRRAAVRAFGMLSDILGSQVAPAVAFDDGRIAGEVLASLSADPQIAAAAVYRQDGSLLGAYRKDPQAPLPVAGPPGDLSDGDGLIVRRAVLQERRPIGVLVLQADLALLREQLRTGVGMILLVLAVASATAFLISLKLGGMITGPILSLAGTVREVTARENYDLRAEPQGKDETGQLIDGFNAMLARIRERDAALQGAKAELERKVVEITDAQARLADQQAELATYHDLVTHDVTNFAGTLLVIMEHLLAQPEATLDPKTRELLRRANRQVYQLNRIATNAKALHRVRRKGLPPASRSMPLAGILRRVVDTVRSVHFDRPFDAEIDCPAELAPLEIPFMENVFLNLVDNAVKHTPKERRPRVGIDARRREDGRVVVRVRGGAPSDTELRTRLFERYVRGPHSTGAGLGLTVVREIVERAGGKVKVANARTGDGAEEFEVTLELPEA